MRPKPYTLRPWDAVVIDGGQNLLVFSARAGEQQFAGRILTDAKLVWQGHEFVGPAADELADAIERGREMRLASAMRRREERMAREEGG